MPIVIILPGPRSAEKEKILWTKYWKNKMKYIEEEDEWIRWADALEDCLIAYEDAMGLGFDYGGLPAPDCEWDEHARTLSKATENC